MSERWGSLEDLAAMSGLSRRALQYIRTREPAVLVARTRGTAVEYNLGACNVHLRRRERALAQRAVREQADPSIIEAERRKAIADARTAEVKLLRLEGRLVGIDEAVQEIENLLLHLRAALLAHPKTRAVAEEILTDLRQQPPPAVQHSVDGTSHPENRSTVVNARAPRGGKKTHPARAA